MYVAILTRRPFSVFLFSDITLRAGASNVMTAFSRLQVLELSGVQQSVSSIPDWSATVKMMHSEILEGYQAKFHGKM